MQEVGGNEKAPRRAGQLAVLAIEVDFGSLPFRLGAQDVLGYPFDLELGEFEGCGFHIAKGSEVMPATGAEQVVGIIGRIAFVESDTGPACFTAELNSVGQSESPSSMG